MNRIIMKSGFLYIMVLSFVIITYVQRTEWNVFYTQEQQIVTINYEKSIEWKDDNGQISKSWEKVIYQNPNKQITETQNSIVVHNGRQCLTKNQKTGKIIVSQYSQSVVPEALVVANELEELIQKGNYSLLGYEDWKGTRVKVISISLPYRGGNEKRYWLMEEVGIWLPCRIVVFEAGRIKSKSSFIYYAINGKIDNSYFNIEEWIRSNNVKHIEIHNR